MYNAKAYSAASSKSPLAFTTITRRDPTEHDVQIEILYCGVCHPDLHQVRNEWSGFMPTVYPCVPGHEIVGRVTKVGSAVSKFKPGDIADALHVSSRTLQRRLQDEGSNFQRVLEEARHHLARHYLHNSLLELNEAAYLLGYEDANSFVRAFRTWEGVPPARWREMQHANAAS